MLYCSKLLRKTRLRESFQLFQPPLPPNPTLTVAPTSLTFSDDGGSQILTITTNQPSYNGVASDSWIIITKNMNGTDTISVLPNTTGTARTGTITYTAGDANPVIVTVTQRAQDTLSVTPANYTIGGGDNSNYTYTVTKSASSYSATTDASWVNITQSAGSFTAMAITDNNTGAPRIANITVTSGDANPVVVTFTQQAMLGLSVTPANIAVEYNNVATHTFTVITTAPSFTATSSDGWINIIQSAGSFTVAATSSNTGTTARTASIVVNGGEDTVPVTVVFIQNPQATLTVTPATYTVPYNDLTTRTYTVVASAGAFTATSNQTWAVVAQSAGSFTVHANANNTTGTSRTATITITSSDATSRTATFVQSAQDTLSVTPITINLAALIGLSVECTATASLGVYVATSNNTAWLTCTQLGNIITVVALTNLTGAARTGTITVTSGNANPITITVTQAAQVVLDVTPTALVFGYDGTETQSVDVSTSGELYTATPNEDWIKVTVDEVTDTFHVEVQPHEGADLRMATITVNDDLENEQEVSVEQLFPPFTHKIEIDLSKEIMRFGPDSEWEAQTTEILTAIDFDDLVATSDDNWVFAEIAVSGGKYYVKVNCTPNETENETGGEERTGYVNIETLSGNGYPARLTVIQGKKW